MNFPKKQAQRLIPLHLLDYATQLQISHPDPTESWGGSGGTYTGGDGINISSENVISVDDTIAKKSEIPTRVKSPFLGVRQTTDGTVLFSETGEDNDYYSVYHVTEPVKVNLRALNTKFGNGLTSSYNTSTRALDVAVDTTTVALKSDIPSLDGYATQTWVQNQGYSTFSGSYNDLTDKPTLATVATSGSYNDLTDKPTIPDTTNMVTTDTAQTITGTKTFDSNLCIEDTYDGFKSYIFPDRVQFMDTNQDITKVTLFSLPTSKPSGVEYILATTNDIPDTTNFVTLDTDQTISGAKTFQNGLITENTTFGMKMDIVPSRFGYTYNNQGTIEKTLFDLPTGKPSGTEQQPTTYTIATTDDIHNPTITFTQGGTTKGTITLNQSGDQTIEFDAGGGGSSAPFEISNMEVDSSNQTITLTIVANS